MEKYWYMYDVIKVICQLDHKTLLKKSYEAMFLVM